MSKSLKGFISYSHENKKEKDRLIKFLAVMEERNELRTWHDGDIIAGDAARQEDILKEVATSDLLLFLVSADSLASGGCKKELEEASKRGIKVISILLEYCDWKFHQLSGVEVLPDKGKPISKWEDKSEGWQNVVDGIREAVEKKKSQTDPSSATQEKELRAELAFQQGNIFMMFGQPDMAIEAYSNAINLNPPNANAYNNRGVAYHRKGKLDLAVKDYNIAIKLNPDDANAYSNRSNVYREMGEFNRAIDDANTAIKLNPNFTEAYSNRGAAYGAKGDFDLAIKDCSKAIELNPNCTEAYSNRGNAYLKKGQVDLAIKDCSKAIELNPDYVGAYINRGNAYMHKQEIDLAIVDYTKAIRLNPRLAKAYFNRGNAYCQKGKFDLAIGDYNKVTQMDPSFVRVYYCRAFAWLHLQEWEKARTDLTFAQEKGADIIVAFYRIYESVVNFEQKTGIQLPEDIAAMLTPP